MRKAAAAPPALAKADKWVERNINGAASEDDVKLIRSMNEFLGVEASAS